MIKTGFTSDINDGSQTRYFIKTHKNGPTEDNPKSLKPSDTKELFIYQFINQIVISPDRFLALLKELHCHERLAPGHQKYGSFVPTRFDFSDSMSL